MAWRLANSLEVLRGQIDKAFPGRSKSSDGTIGDAKHSSRTSDHNPNSSGVVCALDITHDPDHGLDAGELAETLRASADPRIKYIISNRRIANSGKPWRKYIGKNPHTMHCHISVHRNYDAIAPWDIGAGSDVRAVLRDTVSPKPSKPNLVRGSVGAFVSSLQAILGIHQDGDFGPKTEAAVKAFQKKHKLVADGKVGPYTWAILSP